jgi:aminomethyltransferase
VKKIECRLSQTLQIGNPMGLKTPLYDAHLADNAKLVDFGGWDMPIHYGSQIEEHHAVRQAAGVCDVSHMTVVDVAGAQSQAFLRYLLANDVAKLTVPGKALYSAMLNEVGGILDDLIVYLTEDGYRVVVNCATRVKDLAWMQKQSSDFDCVLTERPELAILAIQGPEAIEKVKAIVTPERAKLISELKPFVGQFSGDWFIARTGYTGEKGVEIILPGTDAVTFWQAIRVAGIAAVGLGARDTLRLEAGMNLYGSDMDETVNPFESNMSSTVVMTDDRNFIGKSALLAAKTTKELVGLVMLEKGVLRGHYPIFSQGLQVGEITSGAYSPTLSHSIALARINVGAGPLEVEIRNKRIPVQKVAPPFARNGQQVYLAD